MDSASPPTIRPAVAADADQIAEIYRYYVQNTVITFDYEAPSAADWDARRSGIQARRRPFLVAEDDGVVVGFAYLSDFRAKQAYDWTAEDTIYLRPGATGRGLGHTLLAALLTGLDPTSVRQVVAVIAQTGSDASVRLHQRFGFVETGTLRRIGYKFDRWIDCTVLQYEVDAG